MAIRGQDFVCHLKNIAQLGFDVTDLRVALHAGNMKLFDNAVQRLRTDTTAAQKLREELVILKTKLFLAT